MDYVNAISNVAPGTFVPDIGKIDETPTVSAIPGSVANDPNVTFKDTLQAMLSDVNAKVNASDANVRDLATGATGDIQKVVTSVEEANLSLQYMMAIRSKLIDTYNEISRLNI